MGSERDEGEIIAETFAKFGREGWEMLGTSIIGGTDTIIFFKRPLLGEE